MINTTTTLFWLAVVLGGSEESILKQWEVSPVMPSAWELAEIKDDGDIVGRYYRGKLPPSPSRAFPDQVEYVFDAGQLVAATFYFAEVEPDEAKLLFEKWSNTRLKSETPEPSAVQKAADRVSTYFFEGGGTWKWVVNGADITIRLSCNRRLPTALAEAIGLGAKAPNGIVESFIQKYARIHRRLIDGKTEIEAVRELLNSKSVPRLMRADIKLVLAMMLSASFRNAATHPTQPECMLPLLAEARTLAPQLRTQIDGLTRLCK